MVQKSQPLTKPPQSWGSFGGLGEESAAFGIFFGRKIPRFRNKEVRIPTKDEGGLIRNFEIGPSAPTRRKFRMLLLVSSQFVHPKTYAIAMSCPPNPPNIIIPSSTIQGSITLQFTTGLALLHLIPPHFGPPGPQKPNVIPSTGQPRVSRPRTSLWRPLPCWSPQKPEIWASAMGNSRHQPPREGKKKHSGKEKHQTPPTQKTCGFDKGFLCV